MPRAKPSQKRPPQLSVAVTETQLRTWSRAAKLGRRSLSAWVRLVLDESAEETLFDAKGDDVTKADLRKNLASFTAKMERLLNMRPGRSK